MPLKAPSKRTIEPRGQTCEARARDVLYRRAIRRLVSLALASTLACSAADDPDSDYVGGKADARDCANGRADARTFRDQMQHAAITEAANNASLERLSIFADSSTLRAIAEARAERPFQNLVDLACVAGVGPALLKDLHIMSLGDCGGLSGNPAKSNATPRECVLWARPCDAVGVVTGEPFPDCEADFFVERYVRDIPSGVDPFPMLPLEITFSDDDNYELVDAGGNREFGTVGSRQRAPISGVVGLTVEPPIYRLETAPVIPFCDEIGGECRPEPPTGDSGPCFADQEVEAFGCGDSGLFACCVAN